MGLLATALIGSIAIGGFVWVQARQLARQLDAQAAQISALEAEVQALKEQWHGVPALWQPPPITNTKIIYFAVAGITQNDLIDSLDGSNICIKYGPCANDPAVPNGAAWGLEGFDSRSYVCDSPRTTTIVFSEFVVLPKWSPALDGTVKIQLVEAWNALAQSIYTHESGHVAITKQDLADLNNQAHRLASCAALIAFWSKKSVFSKLEADQAAYHARLHADCRPEIGCLPPGWMGW